MKRYVLNTFTWLRRAAKNDIPPISPRGINALNSILKKHANSLSLATLPRHIPRPHLHGKTPPRPLRLRLLPHPQRTRPPLRCRLTGRQIHCTTPPCPKRHRCRSRRRERPYTALHIHLSRRYIYLRPTPPQRR